MIDAHEPHETPVCARTRVRHLESTAGVPQPQNRVGTQATQDRIRSAGALANVRLPVGLTRPVDTWKAVTELPAKKGVPQTTV